MNRNISKDAQMAINMREYACSLIVREVSIKTLVSPVHIAALGRQRQVDLCEFKQPVYIVSSRTARIM